jgi:flagella basal body P-ring formation protein FlgA
MAVSGRDPADQQVIVRDFAMVSDNLVRIGDLFINAGEKAAREVGYAPAPGRRMVFDARTLYRLARAHGLEWRPMSIHDKAVIERESVIVSGTEVEDQVLAALRDKGIATDGVEVELNNPMLKLHLPADATETVDVEDLNYTAGNRRFSAILTIPGDGLNMRRVRVAGRIHRVSGVPVLARRVMRGEIISERDIEWLQLRSGRIPYNTVLDADALIGLSPKRTLRAGAPVRMSEVQQPVLVSKGGHVTLVLETRRMTLTARGRALEDGARGDTIRVTNAQSHTVVEGEVTGAGTVAVSPSGAMAIN